MSAERGKNCLGIRGEVICGGKASERILCTCYLCRQIKLEEWKVDVPARPDSWRCLKSRSSRLPHTNLQACEPRLDVVVVLPFLLGRMGLVPTKNFAKISPLLLSQQVL